MEKAYLSKPHHRVSNGKIGGTNIKIKTIKRRAFGCQNSHHFYRE
ncbi:transposase [Shouchella shacheensis]